MISRSSGGKESAWFRVLSLRLWVHGLKFMVYGSGRDLQPPGRKPYTQAITLKCLNIDSF